MVVPASGKARPPTVDSFTDGTSRKLVRDNADLGDRRHELADSGIAARLDERPCTWARPSWTIPSPGLGASGGWWVHPRLHKTALASNYSETFWKMYTKLQNYLATGKQSFRRLYILPTGLYLFLSHPPLMWPDGRSPPGKKYTGA